MPLTAAAAAPLVPLPLQRATTAGSPDRSPAAPPEPEPRQPPGVTVVQRAPAAVTAPRAPRPPSSAPAGPPGGPGAGFAPESLTHHQLDQLADLLLAPLVRRIRKDKEERDKLARLLFHPTMRLLRDNSRLDELARVLLGPMSRLLRAELRQERERIGRLRDSRR
ncbi:hypothetical protein KBZ10_03000 [Streptomyces sp. F63]|uniref:hypothetical protein n=1 Tax=Streptomyces sp. F63 TaxID=2824887 RepID=UPI001B39170D|nr:hypothetical protein [Streptomyces sp. F63]MBQ0983516.1 hypothetical protein [Streptomyces sp. F63]